MNFNVCLLCVNIFVYKGLLLCFISVRITKVKIEFIISLLFSLLTSLTGSLVVS